MTSPGIFAAGIAALVLAALSAEAQLIAWTENGSIYRASADGSNKQRIFQASASGGAATGLDYDAATDKLYWDGRSDPSSQTAGHGIVRRMNLDGTKIERLIDSGVGRITYGFAVSAALKRIYIGEHQAMRIAKLDGSGLITLPLKPLYDSVIRVDEVNRKIYYNEGVVFYGIRRASLIGTSPEDVYRGWVAAFAIDFQGKRIYIGSEKDIRRVDLDGSNPQFLVANVSHLISLQLDTLARKMYWMTDEHIFRASLDGSGSQQIVNLGRMATIAKDDMILILPAR
jgi:hypothetical protein